MVARGSKVWQENWEMHIGYLEEVIHGPLFKTFKIPNTNFWSLDKEYPFSVSKVNQVLSLFTCIFWFGVFGFSLCKLLPKRVINYFHDAFESSIFINEFGYIMLFIILLSVGSIYLYKQSKSFQITLDRSKFNYEKEFYYRKRVNQRTILSTEIKSQSSKMNWIDLLITLLKK